MKKIFLLSAGLLVFTMNVNAMPHHDMEAPFVVINPVMEKCNILAEEDDAFTYHGPAKTKLTINKNYVMATCKAEYIVDKENPIDIQGRVEGIDCMVGIPGWAGLEVKGPSKGIGGFTVSQGGVVTATCKAPR
ncbi:MAG: hypothetical protein GQ529_02245 [Methyloprofundus sp.]|nr:hypothetical protein [Methyloprofundus sp.]